MTATGPKVRDWSLVSALRRGTSVVAEAKRAETVDRDVTSAPWGGALGRACVTLAPPRALKG